MEKDITIASRYWGTEGRHAEMTICNNKVSVKGFSIGRYRDNTGPLLENFVEVPKKLR